jgi:hypothetical protein
MAKNKQEEGQTYWIGAVNKFSGLPFQIAEYNSADEDENGMVAYYEGSLNAAKVEVFYTYTEAMAWYAKANQEN